MGRVYTPASASSIGSQPDLPRWRARPGGGTSVPAGVRMVRQRRRGADPVGPQNSIRAYSNPVPPDGDGVLWPDSRPERRGGQSNDDDRKRQEQAQPGPPGHALLARTCIVLIDFSARPHTQRLADRMPTVVGSRPETGRATSPGRAERNDPPTCPDGRSHVWHVDIDAHIDGSFLFAGFECSRCYAALFSHEVSGCPAGSRGDAISVRCDADRLW